MKYSARQIRLVFLGQLWNAKMDFRESAIAEAKSVEALFDVSIAPTLSLSIG
jgi:cysteinyl-tRNA synthetase